MSASGQKPTCPAQAGMSASPPEADICDRHWHVCQLVLPQNPNDLLSLNAARTPSNGLAKSTGQLYSEIDWPNASMKKIGRRRCFVWHGGRFPR
jgi:hypothetical protein